VLSSPPERLREEEATEALIEVMRLATPEVDVHGLMRSILEHPRHWAGCQAAAIRLNGSDSQPYSEVLGSSAECVSLEDGLCGNVLLGCVDPEEP
jgi:hypothetical protein